MKPLKKVRNEIQRKEEILATVQSELEVLREQERQLENSEMIAAIRNAKFSADDMLALVQAMKKGGTDLSALIPLAINATTTPTPFSESEDENHEVEED